MKSALDVNEEGLLVPRNKDEQEIDLMRPPSQPSPFSPELQSFIVTKFDPLLTIVRELNDRLHAAEKDRTRLEKRVAQLEHYTKLLQDGQHGPIDDSIESTQPLDTQLALSGEEVLKAPWLFSCQLGTPTASLQVLLEFSPDNTEELDVRQWNVEEDMWLAFLGDLPPTTPLLNLPRSNLKDLRATARSILLDLCKRELLLILREVPGKQSVAHRRHSITFVAIIAAALSEAWTRIERTEPSILGRIALVLEGEGIGTRLRAGHHKFIVEPLN